MWCHHPFSQRNRIAERTVGVGIGGDRELGDGGGGGGGGGFEKCFTKGVGNIGRLQALV